MTPNGSERAGAAVTVQIVVPIDPEALPIGGIATFVRGFVRHAPADFAIELVGTTGSRPIGRWLASALDGREIRHLPVARRKDRRGRLPLTASFVAGLIRHRRAIPGGRVQQFHRPATALPLLSVSGPKVRVVHLTTADLTSSGAESTWRRLGPWLRLAERRALARMDHIYLVNEAAWRDYRLQLPRLASRMSFVPNWVDDGVFRSPSAAERIAARTELRAAIGLPPERRLVLFAGRLERQKDPLLAVRAVAALPGDGTHLVIAGDGTLRPDVDREAAAIGRGRVHLLGTVAQEVLARWMLASDALLISSHFETGPTVGLEALATGLPVVTTDVGTVARIVAGGSAGAVAATHDVATLADALATALGTDEAQRRAAALLAVEPYRAANVLPRLYDDARALAARHS